MDLFAYDARGRAEKGEFMQLRDPITNEPIDAKDGKHPGFVVRGLASRSAQRRFGAMLAKMKDEQEAADDTEGESPLEKAHEALIEQAMDYIVEPRNLEVDGEPVKTEAQIRRVLDMTFPQMSRTDDDKWEVVNKTFAQQVIEFAEDQAHFFG